ncbi:MAG TPA: protein kinase [Pirellulales bacterium]|nr:protein kinase [Pirellulales bacterium]
MSQVKSAQGDRAVNSGLVAAAELARGRAELGAGADDARLLDWLVRQGLLTKWQVAQLEAGRSQNLILGHYKLLAPLGAGGMGSVYRALDTKLNRQVAVKVLPPRLATPDAIGRFRREAFVALQLRHDHVVTSFELAQHGSLHFLAMELVDGPSLSAHLAKQKRLGVRETARIGHEVALALEHARELGIIHRDIKPSNILLSRQGNVKVADMGLAKFFGPQAQAGGPDTRTGQFMGTIDYCSPEQAVDAKRADIRSDIYSLGCTLYHCLTGKPPFAEGTEVQRIMAHIDILPAAIRVKNRDVPPAFAELIEKRMLAKDPGDRFQTPAEAAEALAPWARGEAGASANPWAGLESLDGLLDEVALAPIQKPAVQRERETRPSHRRPTPTLRVGAARRHRGAKDESLFRRPFAWAAVALVVLATITAASLLWPRKKPDEAVAANAGPILKGRFIPQPPSVGPDQSNNPNEQGEPPDADPADTRSDLGDSNVEPPSIDVPAASGAKGDGTGGASPSASAPPDAKDVDKPPIEPAARKVPGLVLTVKHGARVASVAVSADGSTLMTGGDDKTARLWNATDGAPRGAPLMHEAGVKRVSLSADGSYAVTYQPRSRFNFTIKSDSRASQRPLSFSYSDGTPDLPDFSLWDVSAEAADGRKPLLTARGELAIAADGKEALALDKDAGGTVWLVRFELANRESRYTILASAPNRTMSIQPILFSPDLRLLLAEDFSAALMRGRKLRKSQIPTDLQFWDTSTGKTRGKARRFSEGTASFPYTAVVSTFRPDSRALAVVITTYSRTSTRITHSDSNPRLQLLDLASARVLKEFTLSRDPNMIAFNPRGDLLACIGRGALELRDAETGEVRGPRTPMTGVTSAAFSGDGKRLFVGKYDGTAELWELDTLLAPAEK